MLQNNTKNDFIEKSFKSQFVIDLIEKDDQEVKIKRYPLPYYQEILKKWKDILTKRILLQTTTQSLEEVNQKLAGYSSHDGMEMPGQYLELDTEPFPNTRIFITKLSVKMAQDKRRLHFRTTTEKSLIYAISSNICRGFDKDYKMDEMLTQFKIFMNKILLHKHPETMRRGIRFGVYKKITFPQIKLTEANQVISFDEIYETACSDYGFDSDTSTVLFSRDIKEILKDKMSDHIPKLEKPEMEKAVKDCNRYMRRLIPKTHLATYCKEQFETVDDFFMFRKQFTHYHASNSFLTYAFKLHDNMLKNLRVCMKHGRTFHADLGFAYNSQGSGLENPYESAPFRLSDNIRELISEPGMTTLFP